MRKSKKLTKQIVTELEKVPNISLVCAKLGISRQTLYRWKEEDFNFSDAIEEAMVIGYESVNDLAESKLTEKIKEGSMSAIKYHLSNNHKRYIRPRPNNSHGNRKAPRNEIMFVDFSTGKRQTLDELRAEEAKNAKEDSSYEDENGDVYPVD